MCGGEPRAMLKKDRGKADSPIYTMQICIPKHGPFLHNQNQSTFLCDKIVLSSIIFFLTFSVFLMIHFQL